jgi:hypothetical protein
MRLVYDDMISIRQHDTLPCHRRLELVDPSKGRGARHPSPVTHVAKGGRQPCILNKADIEYYTLTPPHSSLTNDSIRPVNCIMAYAGQYHKRLFIGQLAHHSAWPLRVA